jgi:hypothetical protein
MTDDDPRAARTRGRRAHVARGREAEPHASSAAFVRSFTWSFRKMLADVVLDRSAR